MGLSVWQIAVVVILFMLMFGRGRLSGLMSDLAEGIKSFRTSLKDDELELEAGRKLSIGDQPMPERTTAEEPERVSQN